MLVEHDQWDNIEKLSEAEVRECLYEITKEILEGYYVRVGNILRDYGVIE